MAFQHPQQRRTRHVPQREDSSPLLDDSGELSTSVDSEVLLFGGQSSSNALRLSSAAVPSSSTIDQSWALLHNRTQSPASSTHRSSSISTTSSSRDRGGQAPLASPASLTHSLFPSHDGGGIFIAGSLVQSDEGGLGTGATYATEEEDGSLPSGSSALSDTSSSSFSGADARGCHAGLHAPLGGSSIGGSWALTEEALSTVPHATPLGGVAAVLHSGSGSADFTEDSSDDESLVGIVVGRRRTPTRRIAGELEDDDEVLLSATPHAASAGMLSESGRGGRGAMYSRRYEWKEDDESIRSREAYPSPPPEGAMAGGSRIRIKRRHRQSGRNAGSQKRSSASGSIAGAEAAIVASPLLLGGKTTRRPQEVAAQQLEEDKILRLKAEKDVLLGGVASRLMEIDTATLELVATVRAPPTPEATPTPSRATSPTPHLVTPRQHSRKAAHGIHALAQHARDELGDSSMYSLSGGEEEDSGEETETEVDHSHKPVQQQWHTATTPPTLAPRRAPASSSASSTSPPPRTLSASSLPLYLSDALAPLTHTNLANSASTLKPPGMPFIRRTSSYSSSGAVLPGGEENPWGGEFEGFEAAMSYWRRLLRRMRGF